MNTRLDGILRNWMVGRLSERLPIKIGRQPTDRQLSRISSGPTLEPFHSLGIGSRLRVQRIFDNAPASFGLQMP